MANTGDPASGIVAPDSTDFGAVEYLASTDDLATVYKPKVEKM